MRSYAALLNSATEGAPFSNSTEGSAWTANWCDKCSNDRGAPDDGCPILLVGLIGKTPAEWLPADRLRLGAQYRCTEFKKARKVHLPRPVEIPGQLALWSELSEAGELDDLLPPTHPKGQHRYREQDGG